MVGDDRLAKLAQTSPYGQILWRAARDRLSIHGFSDEDTLTVLEAAMKNRFNPVTFAAGAINLRDHVGKGLPL